MEGDLERELRRAASRIGIHAVQWLSERYAEWAKHEAEPKERYKNAQVAVQDIHFTAEDAKTFINSLKEYGGDWKYFGIFTSALLNRVMGDDTLLELRIPTFSYAGSFLERGTLSIEAENPDSRFWHPGYALNGAKVIVKSPVYTGYGNEMQDGKLDIEGMVTGPGLSGVKGGHAILHSIERNLTGSDVDGIGNNQSGGVIDFLDDFVTSFLHLGANQSGGKIRAKNIEGYHIGLGKSGGEIIAENILNTIVGNEMTGGDITILYDAGSPERLIMLGYQQKGGIINVGRNVYGTVGQDTSQNATIYIRGNVHGRVGWTGTQGLRVRVDGNVFGDVGDGVKDMRCDIQGDVKGNVGKLYGYEYAKGRVRSHINIHGNLKGDIGPCVFPEAMIQIFGNHIGTVREIYGGEIYLGGGKGAVEPMVSGSIYHNGKQIGRTKLAVNIGRMLGLKFRGDH